MFDAKRRFWLETGLGVLGSVGAVVTVIWRDWIELLFGADPDAGSGALEWTIVGVSALVALSSFLLATSEWQRNRPLWARQAHDGLAE